MQLRIRDYFTARIVIDSQSSQQLGVRSSVLDFFKRIIYLIYSPASYLEENRKALACFKKYVTENNVKHNLDLARMEKEGSPLFMRNITQNGLDLKEINGISDYVAPKITYFKKNPLLHLREKADLSSIDLTRNPPKGFTNDGNNCWVNALIQTFVSDPSFLASIKRKQESSDPLTQVLVKIVNSYKSASHFNDSVVEENSQMVREALHSISDQFCSSLSSVQEDAALNMSNILGRILGGKDVPLIESNYKYELNGLPEILLYPSGETTIIKTPSPVIQLPINLNNFPSNLNDLLDCFYQDPIEHTQRGTDGKDHDYSGVMVRKFINAPETLRFQLGRFGFDPDNLGFKIKDPIQIPENVEITLKNGDKKIYQLRSFINHHGNTLKSGHYTACRKIGNEMYWMNDNTVTKIDEATWKNALNQSYIVSYELANESDLRNNN